MPSVILSLNSNLPNSLEDNNLTGWWHGMIKILYGRSEIWFAVVWMIAYVMLAIASFSYATSRRSAVYVIIWIVAVVLIAVSYII